MIRSARSFFIDIDVHDEKIISEITRFQRVLLREKFAEIQLVDNYHITLSFLGKLQWKDVNRIKVDLEKIRMDSFYVTLRGVRYFPSEKFPIRILWINVESSKLYSLVEEICKMTLGYHEENVPHITVARIRKIFNLEGLMTNVKKYQDYYFGNFHVRSFRLKANLGRLKFDKKYVDIKEYFLL